MTHLTVLEWGSIPVSPDHQSAGQDTFSRSQANVLLAAARAHPLANVHGTNVLIDRHSTIFARQMVGVIAAPGCSLEILPKNVVHANSQIENYPDIRQRLIRMLDVALGLRISDGPVLGMARQGETLLDILIRVFAGRLLAETRRGLPHAYVGLEDDLPTLRGKLDLRRQFTTLATRPDRLACRYDALISDTALLRIMKACVVFLRPHARTQETIRRLEELRFVLAEVSDVASSALPWADVRIDRTHRRWEALYGLARLFLKRQWQATHFSKGGALGITLLFAMNDLFEAYIAALARRALSGTGLIVHVQGGLKKCLIDDQNNQHFQTRPDLLIRRDGQILTIIDTKWKLIGHDPLDKESGVAQSDVYQMMAYARLYQCQKMILLYPHHASAGDQVFNARYSMAGGDERLHLCSVDIAAEEPAILQRLAGLVSPVEADPISR